jgi:hypothetical protein
VVETLGGGAFVKEVECWGSALEMCICLQPIPLCFLVSVSSSSIPHISHHDVLPHRSPETMQEADHGLKPLEV